MRQVRLSVLIFAFLIDLAPPGNAQNRRAAPAEEAEEEEPTGAVVRGVVRDSETGQPIPGAEVLLVGTDRKTVTGPEGRFEIAEAPPGGQTLEVYKEGYLAARFPLSLREGQAVEIPVGLKQEQAETVLVIERRRGTSVVQRVELQRTAAGQVSGRSREEIAQGPGSNAAGVARQLPSVTAVDNKYIYVRGLGDRYSQTLLNNASVPSPEPDKRVIPLDLFPANLLDSIAIQKTYSPDLPGEFAGGSVQIHTVDVPEQSFFSLGGEVKYRNGTTFRDFKTYHGGNLDTFAFDDGTRKLPSDVPPRVVEGVDGLTSQDIQDIGRSFPNIWNPDVKTAPLDHKLSMSFGKSIGQPGESSFGVVGAINWANRYQTIPNETRRILTNNDRINPKPTIFSDFVVDSYTFEAELSALLSLTYEINPGQKIGVRSIYTRSAEDLVREQTGTDGAQQFPVRVALLRWVSRSLFTVQPYGEHLLGRDTLLEWRAGYSLSQRDEPDNRQVRYISDQSGTFSFEPSRGSSGRRNYYQLDENIYDVGADYSIPFNPLGIDREAEVNKKAPEQRIKIGPAFVYRDRDFDTRRFGFEKVGTVDENGNPIDLTLDPESIFNPRNIHPGGLELEEVTRPTDSYQANQKILAAYAMADFRVHRDVRVQAGARVENSRQEVKTAPLFGNTEGTITTTLDNTDILPAGSLIWEFWKSKPPAPPEPSARPEPAAPPAALPPTVFEPPQVMQLRLAASQTVSRPEFRELAPFEYNDVLGGSSAVGNPNLQRAKISNFDLGWEWYPTPSESFSAGVFYKAFDSPIEVVTLPTSGAPLTTWQNAETANLYGIEIETRKSLGMIRQELRELSLIANFAYMQSEVNIKPDPSQLQTNSKRPLQGQPEYVLNLGLLWDFKEKTPLQGTTISILANNFGERISAVGAGGLPDEKEMPRWSLDLVLSKRVGKATVRAAFENILNDKYEFKQGDVTTREFRRGWAMSLGLSFSF